MITRDRAIAIVRRKYDKFYIVDVFEYNDAYHFTLLSKFHKEMLYDQSIKVTVDMDTGALDFPNMAQIVNNDLDGYGAARKKAVTVDKIE